MSYLASLYLGGVVELRLCDQVIVGSTSSWDEIWTPSALCK